MKILGISFGFNKRNKAADALPAPESNNASTDLIARFQHAVYGVTCRTVAYPGLVAGELFYYRALAVTTTLDQWQIQKITERAVQVESDAKPVATPNRKIEVVKEGLGFFDALTYFARIEKTADKDPIGPTRKELGNDHYEAFGLLHDIIPDIHGMPHPTIGGHPVLGGVYADCATAALDDARGQVELKAVLAPKTRMDVRGNMLNMGLKLSEFLVQSKKESDLRRAAQLMKMWVELCEDIWSTDDFRMNEKKGGNSSHYVYEHKAYLHGVDVKCYSYTSGYEYRARSIFNSCEKAWQDMKTLSAAESAAVIDYLREAAYIAMVQDAAYILLSIRDPKDDSERGAKIIRSIRDDAMRLQAEAKGEHLSTGSKAAQDYKLHFMSDVENWTMLKALPDHLVSTADTMQRLADQAAEMSHKVLVEAKAQYVRKFDVDR
ncbi:hypothetical protein [Micavibrio aeruginosavorus]|uniref:hypothetical protein n=1 Tax=Micavibrio aeruginosavorus TaxID=349221 RepID=UPI003F4AE737